MQLALAMSMSQEGSGVEAAPGAAATNPEVSAMFHPVVESVLGSLPGVDPNDLRIRSVIDSLPKDGEEKLKEATATNRRPSRPHTTGSFHRERVLKDSGARNTPRRGRRYYTKCEEVAHYGERPTL